MIRGQSFIALVQRASANPPCQFRIGYRKIGTLIEINDDHIMMVGSTQNLLCSFLMCARTSPLMQTREEYAVEGRTTKVLPKLTSTGLDVRFLH